MEECSLDLIFLLGAARPFGKKMIKMVRSGAF